MDFPNTMSKYIPRSYRLFFILLALLILCIILLLQPFYNSNDSNSNYNNYSNNIAIDEVLKNDHNLSDVENGNPILKSTTKQQKHVNLVDRPQVSDVVNSEDLDFKQIILTRNNIVEEDLEWARPKRHSPAAGHYFGTMVLEEFSGHPRQRSMNMAANITNNITSGNAILFPVTFNAANYTKIKASSTCGLDIENDETYCQLVGGYSVFKTDMIIEGLPCDLCLANHPNKSHHVENVLDSSEKWWMSPPLSRGLKYKEVNLTLNFSQAFEIPYIYLTMANSPRPDVWILEKSMDYGKTWMTWQYFTTSQDSCQEYFPHAPTKIEKDDSVICTYEYSGIFPLECGEIPISLVKGRPAFVNNDINKELLTFITATNIRIRFIKPKTVSGVTLESEPRPGITRRIFYSIQEIDIAARCICNGHAERCMEQFSESLDKLSKLQPNVNSPDKVHELSQYMKTMHCQCQHNTEGDQCQYCKEPYVAKRWRPAYELLHDPKEPQQMKFFECEPCQCHNHSQQCQYNSTVDQLKLSLDIHGKMEGGGVCMNCEHHTTGINCNQCLEGYYHPIGRAWTDESACVPCDCDPRHTTGKCDINGHCECLPGSDKEKSCSKCKERYFGDNLKKNCTACNCDWQGASGCDSITGQCICLPNVTGARCDQCEPNHFGLELGTGCRLCKCGAGSLDEQCHLKTGQCQCRPGVMGRTCEQCDHEHFNFDISTGRCLPCQCHPQLSRSEDIIQINSRKMNQTATTTTKLLTYIHAEQQVQTGLQRLCEQYTGQCICKVNVIGRDCGKCKYGFVENGNKGCKKCGDCEDTLFEQLKILETNMNITMAYINDNRHFEINWNIMNYWGDEMKHLELSFGESRRQLRSTMKHYTKELNLSATLPDTLSDSLYSLNVSHTIEIVNGVGNKLKQLNNRQQFYQQMAIKLNAISAALGPIPRRLKLLQWNSAPLEMYLDSIRDHFDGFMAKEQVVSQQLTSSLYGGASNSAMRSNYIAKDTIDNVYRKHSENDLLLSKRVASMEQFESTVAELHNATQIVHSYKVTFMAILEDYANLNKTLAEAQSLIKGSKQRLQSIRRMFDGQAAPMLSNKNIIINSNSSSSNNNNKSEWPESGQAISFQFLYGVCRSAQREINSLESLINGLSIKKTTIENFLSDLDKNGIMVKQVQYLLDKMNVNTTHLTASAFELRKIRDTILNETLQMDTLLAPLGDFQYLTLVAPSISYSLEQLYQLSDSPVMDKKVAQINFLSDQMWNNKQYKNDTNNMIEQSERPQREEAKKKHQSSDTLNNLRLRLKHTMDTHDTLIKETQTHINKLAPIRAITWGFIALPNYAEQAMELRHLASGRMSELQDWLDVVRSVSRRADNYANMVRDKQIMNKTIIQVESYTNRLRSFPQAASSSNNDNVTSPFADINKLNNIAKNISDSMRTLKDLLNSTRYTIDHLQIGAQFNGEQCSKLRPINLNTNNASTHQYNNDHGEKEAQASDEPKLTVSMMVRTNSKEGLLFFLGTPQLATNRTLGHTEYVDYVALVLDEARPVLEFYYRGRETMLIQGVNTQINDDQWHRIEFTVRGLDGQGHKQSGDQGDQGDQGDHQGSIGSVSLAVSDSSGESATLTTKTPGLYFTKLTNHKHWPVTSIYVGGAPKYFEEVLQMVPFRNFNGTIYELHMNNVKLHVLNLNHNGILFRGHFYKPDGVECASGPSLDFLPNTQTSSATGESEPGQINEDE